MAYGFPAYALGAAMAGAAGLASAPRPRSTIIVTAAALLWPATMAAIVLHALIITYLWSNGPASGSRDTTAIDDNGSHAAAIPGWPAL